MYSPTLNYSFNTFNPNGFGGLSSPSSASGIFGSTATKGKGSSNIFGTLTSGLGSGVALTPLLSALELDKNISLIQEFGLSSWGASTDPTRELAKVQEQVIPQIQQKLQSLTIDNANVSLTWLDGYIQFIYTGSKHLREHHARAGSTQEALKQVMSKMQELRRNFVVAVVDELKSKGMTVVKTEIRKDYKELENTYSYMDGQIMDSTHKYMVTYNSYKITPPESNFKNTVNQFMGGSQKLIGQSNQLLSASWFLPFLLLGTAILWMVKGKKGKSNFKSKRKPLKRWKK